jgi:hypothetical protein
MSRLLSLPLAFLLVPLGCARPAEVAEAERAPAAPQPAPPAVRPVDPVLVTTIEKGEPEEKNLTTEDPGLETKLEAARPEVARPDKEAVDTAVPNTLVGLPRVGDELPDSPGPAVFLGRSGATKSKLLKEGGGNAESERAVALGLAWLAKQQKQDGNWEFDQGSKEERGAATGMALLPFLAAGCTHKTETVLAADPKAKYKDTVNRGLEFLKKMCPPSGSNAGKTSDNRFAQAVATLALCEAYGLTKDPELKPHAQAALNFIQKSQAENGGWSDKPDGKSDLAVVGWQVQALFSGKMTKDLVIDDRVVKKAIKFLDSAAAGPRKSAYGTLDATDAKPGTTLTAIGLLCRYHIDGWGPSHPGMIDGVAGVVKNPPSATNCDSLHLYYTTWLLAGYEGEDWKTWNEGPKGADGRRKGGVRDLLCDPHIRKDDATLGSWAADGDFGKRYGRLGTTALNVLTLEVYYRYLPLYKRGDDGSAVKILEDK